MFVAFFSNPAADLLMTVILASAACALLMAVAWLGMGLLKFSTQKPNWNERLDRGMKFARRSLWDFLTVLALCIIAVLLVSWYARQL
jgi:hypothetical protein